MERLPGEIVFKKISQQINAGVVSDVIIKKKYFR